MYAFYVCGWTGVCTRGLLNANLNVFSSATAFPRRTSGRNATWLRRPSTAVATGSRAAAAHVTAVAAVATPARSGALTTAMTIVLVVVVCIVQRIPMRAPLWRQTARLLWVRQCTVKSMWTAQQAAQRELQFELHTPRTTEKYTSSIAINYLIRYINKKL